MRALHLVESALLAALLVLALGTPARAQPIDTTLTEIPAPFTRVAESRFGSDFDFDGARLAVTSNDRVDTFLWNATTVTHEATPMPTSGDFRGFGDSHVRIDGDRMVVVAGEAFDFTQPALYVLERSSGTWLQTARMFDPAGIGDPVITDLAFGGTRILVGCGYSRNNRGIGAIARSNASGVFSWTATPDVRVVGAVGDLNGFQVALDGDLVALSSIEAGGRVGRVQLFRDTGTALMLLATMENPTPGDRDQFGLGVALAGGFVFAAARYDDTAGVDAGALYVYDTTGALRQTILGPATPPRAMFGSNVRVDGDWMAVGAQAVFSNAPGAVLFYQRGATGTWQYRGRVDEPEGRSGTGFGSRLELVGRTFVVSSVTSPVGGAVNAGRAWIGVITEPNGGACTANAQCTNGHCVGGICCNTGCAGACDVCSTGTCVVTACDAGMAPDAGLSGDSGTSTDAGTLVDAGVVDARVAADLGATSDAASASDASSADGGRPDSSAVGDAGRLDASRSDATGALDAGAVPRVPLSCTCRAGTSDSGTGALALLSGVALLGWTRRRR